jgi:hypothetical protein
LEYLPRHSWRALRFQLENPSAALACEEALLQEVAEQIKVFGLVAAATRDNALFSRVRKQVALDWVNRMVLSGSLRYLPSEHFTCTRATYDGK